MQTPSNLFARSGAFFAAVLFFGKLLPDFMSNNRNDKLLRDARFHFDSFFHSIMDVVHLVLVMVLVLYIESGAKVLVSSFLSCPHRKLKSYISNLNRRYLTHRQGQRGA